MSYAAAFSPDYVSARARFRSSAMALGCTLEEHPIGQKGPDGDPLTIDVAWLGAREATRAVVVSSGLHGVEGFLGSAIQAAMLEEHLGGWRPPEDARLVFLHGLNPYGFAWVRRVNEQNVDLNRNFLRPGEPYTGSPPGYAELDRLLNPRSAPLPVEAFLLKAAVEVARHGMPTLKNAVAGGQYDYPEGLFFGGSGPSETYRILDAELPGWIGGATDVLHVDVHTGLGPWATYKLFADREVGSERFRWLGERFGHDVVEPWAPDDTSYAITGGLGTWCQHRLPGVRYDVLACEFGTYPSLKVAAALRRENRAHHYARPNGAIWQRAKRDLREIFAPTDADWRDRCVAQGVGVVHTALDALFAG